LEAGGAKEINRPRQFFTFLVQPPNKGMVKTIVLYWMGEKDLKKKKKKGGKKVD